MLPIVWNEAKQLWSIYDQSGKELWSTEKYSDASQFAQDYISQQKSAAQQVAKGLQ
jgi:hypothetical protein